MQKKALKLNCLTCSGRAKSIFCDLHQQEIEMLNNEKSSNHYVKGQNLFLTGNPPFGLYCIHSGQVKVSKVNAEGRETIIRIIGQGGILGHRSLFSDTPYSASATVMSDSIICFVSKQTIKSLIKEDPALSFNIISKVSSEMGAAEDKLASMARKSVRERFAEMLLLLKENFGVIEDKKIKLDVRLTREEMSSMVGAASENITRLITDFKKEGFISQNGKDIYIENIDEIEKEASLGY